MAATDHMLAILGEELTRPVLIGGVRVVLGSRVGFATPEPGDDAEAMIRRAYQALHGARESDGATIHLAEPEGVAPIDALAVDLHLGLSRGEIGVVFQPQVEVASGRIVGVEALARWEHPRWGPLGAATLFRCGRARRSGHRALRPDPGPGPVARRRLAARVERVAAVAQSDRRRCRAPGFAATFLDRVDASGFPRGRLTVELTETGMIREMKTVAGLLAELRAAGCRIAIDDFGTGYSSLAYLKALPLDYVKLDKALVDEIAGSPRDRVVVRGVIDIARALGLAVIAEGWRRPRSWRCSRPRDAVGIRGFCAPVRCGKRNWSPWWNSRDDDADDPACGGGGAAERRRGTMADSAAAWNRGDLSAFVAVYAEDAVFVTAKGLVRGRAAIAARYAPSFRSGGNARGRLSFETLYERPIDATHRLLIARWTLTAGTRWRQA